jgi:hypothetical protein
MVLCYSGRDIHCFGPYHVAGNFTDANTEVVLQQETRTVHTFFS